MVPSPRLKSCPTSALALGAVMLLFGGCGTDGAPPVTSTGASLAGSRTAFADMSARAREVVSTAQVPFLLLPRPWAPNVIATAGPRWSALSVRDGELTISLHGTDATHQTLDPNETRRAAPDRRVRGVPARITENEGIRSVAWSEAGVYWALEVECFHHDTDPRCTEDAFLLDLATRLETGPRPGASTQPGGAQ